jgi:hypothetical protein
VSDFAGIVSVAPLVIGIATVPRRPPARREVIESVAALGVLVAMSGVIVSLPRGPWETVVPAALVFPILLWLAARWQPVQRGGCFYRFNVGFFDRDLRPWPF